MARERLAIRSANRKLSCRPALLTWRRHSGKTGFACSRFEVDPLLPDYGYTATLLTDGRVLFLGSDDYTADAEVYDPAAGTFASTGSTVSQELAPASRLTDGTVLIAGGQLVGGNGSTDAELYVPATGTFEFAGEMTAGRHSHTATLLPDDTVLITGGYSIWPSPTSSAEVYKPR